jgi:hypothetical protein
VCVCVCVCVCLSLSLAAHSDPRHAWLYSEPVRLIYCACCSGTRRRRGKRLQRHSRPLHFAVGLARPRTRVRSKPVQRHGDGAARLEGTRHRIHDGTAGTLLGVHTALCRHMVSVLLENLRTRQAHRVLQNRPTCTLWASLVRIRC